MKRTIWKFPIDAGLHNNEGKIEVDMPQGANVLHVGFQGGEICLWAMVDADEPKVSRRTFRIVGTGHPAPPAEQYLGTVHDNRHGTVMVLVWHIFEL